MNPCLDLRVQSEIRQWTCIERWVHQFAVTLTLKQSRQLDGVSSTYLTPELASRNVRHFLNLLNKQLYGSAAQRSNKRIRSLAVAEGTATKRLHYHLMLDCPQISHIEHFSSMVAAAWAKTDWGYPQIEVRSCDKGWLKYITKFRDKPDFASAFDWELCHNPN